MAHYKLLCILAHPDDESMGVGGILAKYAAEGVETYLITATRGERGWMGKDEEYPGPQTLAKIRETELQAAARVLRIKEVHILDYRDGELDQADPGQMIGKLVELLRKIRPQVVVTFGPSGYYGHPDHIAISQFTMAAVLAAADDGFKEVKSLAPHRVAKVYYLAANSLEQAAYQAAFGDLAMKVDGVERKAQPWADWAITTRIDTRDHWEAVWQAISCHRSQLPGYQTLRELPEEKQKSLWGTQTLYRALSLVNGGREVEHDLFSGLNGTDPEKAAPVPKMHPLKG
jgi:LmbE family N-acetylglucosaminyl deacetylase